METVHPVEYAAKLADETPRRRKVPAPDYGPTVEDFDAHVQKDTPKNDEDDEDLPSRFQRILHLLRPLTSLVTRITTTLETQDADYDSDPLEEPTPASNTAGKRQDSAKEKPNTEEEVSRREFHPKGAPIVTGEGETGNLPTGMDSPWFPFRSGYEFRLAKWMMDANLSKVQIDAFFNSGLARAPPANPDGSAGVCFTSAHTLGQLLDEVDEFFSKPNWKKACVNHHGAGLIEFRFRSLEDTIRHIFKQASHADYMIYTPYKDFHRKTGYRIYSEMASGHWWWHMQVRSFLYPPIGKGFC